MTTSFLRLPDRPALAYDASPSHGEGAALPTLVFLPGYRSDMAGTKALYLQEQCTARGQAFVRFDYSAHGESEGDFKDGTITGWTQDALDIIDHLTDGPVILAGSSMGGWIALNCALARPARIAGLVGIAAAPDFTMWIEESLTPAMREDLKTKGYFEEPNAYSDEPYIFTAALLADGAQNLRLNAPLPLTIPVRLVQGMADEDVPWQTAHRIRNAIIAADAAAEDRVRVTLVEHGDHRLSRPEDLALIDACVMEISEAA